jgi:hypothetical protein
MYGKFITKECGVCFAVLHRSREAAAEIVVKLDTPMIFADLILEVDSN